MERNQVIFVAIATLAVLIFLSTQLFNGLQDEQTIEKSVPDFKIGEYAQETESAKSNFAVKDYSFTVSSEKPESVIASFADESESEEKQATELTIYNQNLALVKEYRTLDLKQGLNLVKYTDIASQIKADTVLFTDLVDPSTFVVEQNYEYDIVNKSKLLDKYLDKEITVKTKEGELYTGKLLSHTNKGDFDQLLLQTDNQVVSLNEVLEIYFPELSEGLLTKPSLVWKIYTESTGERETETTYLTNGLTWEADYIAKINSEDNMMDFKGWVTTQNTSGTTYPATTLKLVAGDLHLTQEQQRYKTYDLMYEQAMPTGASPNAFNEESMFEYHMYSLDRVTDIKNNETKQISLLSSPGVSVTKKFVFDTQRRGWYGASNDGKSIQVLLEFENSDEAGLGMPLPKGTVRVYKEDSQGKLQFIGEDAIDHTPKDEEMSLLLGYAFDIVGEQKTTASNKITSRCWEYDYEISLRNHKEEAVTVYAVAHASGDNELRKASHDYTKKDAFKYEFPIEIEADGEETLTYTIRTCW